MELVNALLTLLSGIIIVILCEFLKFLPDLITPLQKEKIKNSKFIGIVAKIFSIELDTPTVIYQDRITKTLNSLKKVSNEISIHKKLMLYFVPTFCIISVKLFFSVLKSM
jgi:hypothetical protein